MAIMIRPTVFLVLRMLLTHFMIVSGHCRSMTAINFFGLNINGDLNLKKKPNNCTFVYYHSSQLTAS